MTVEHADDCKIRDNGITCTCDAPYLGAKPMSGYEQPMPTPNNEPGMHDLVIKDLLLRKDIGIERYNTVLQPFNGRDVARDALEESLDLVAYLKQWQIEWYWLMGQLSILYNAHTARNTVTQSQVIHEIAEKMGWKDAE